MLGLVYLLFLLKYSIIQHVFECFSKGISVGTGSLSSDFPLLRPSLVGGSLLFFIYYLKRINSCMR